MGKNGKKKCFCICCHKKGSQKIKRTQRDLKGVLWKVYVCERCGHEFCEPADGSGGRKEPKDLIKKEKRTNL